MNRIALLLFLLLNLTLYGQDEKSNKSVDNAIKATLVAKGIRNYFSYSIYDRPINYVEETTNEISIVFEVRTYIFWKEKGKYYIQKTDKVTSYDHMEIDASIFNFALNNITKINAEKVKPYKEKQGNQLVEIVSSSPSYMAFDFNINKFKFNKEIKFFDLYNEPNFKNYNYQYNQQLKLIQLRNLCDKLVARLEKENKL